MRCLLFAVVALSCLVTIPFAARAQDTLAKPDDTVVFDVAAEDWVTTKTARVIVSVEAAVNAGNAGSARADMMKAVGDLAKAEWRLTSFNRSMDQTGLERWSAAFEARLAEGDLNGLSDRAKKLGKAGLQLSIAAMDFQPTLDERENARSLLRTKIYRLANEQLASLNATLAGRNFRIANLVFTGADHSPVMPMDAMMGGRPGVGMVQPMMARAMASSEADAVEQPAERAEKIVQTARVVFAATPSVEGKH